MRNRLNSVQYRMRLKGVKRAQKFPFLKYLKDKTPGKDFYKLANLPTCYRGELWFSDGVPELIFFIDSQCLIKDYMSLNEKLTKKIKKDFEETYEWGGHWADWRAKWAEKQGYETGGSGNTYNEDSYYFWGSVFEYTVLGEDGEDGAIVMWHYGGDVRGNYSDPEIWEGDFNEFWLAQFRDPPEEEMAYLLGYGGDAEALKRDLELWSGKGKLSGYKKKSNIRAKFNLYTDITPEMTIYRIGEDEQDIIESNLYAIDRDVSHNGVIDVNHSLFRMKRVEVQFKEFIVPALKFFPIQERSGDYITETMFPKYYGFVFNRQGGLFKPTQQMEIGQFLDEHVKSNPMDVAPGYNYGVFVYEKDTDEHMDQWMEHFKTLKEAKQYYKKLKWRIDLKKYYIELWKKEDGAFGLYGKPLEKSDKPKSNPKKTVTQARKKAEDIKKRFKAEVKRKGIYEDPGAKWMPMWKDYVGDIYDYPYSERQQLIQIENDLSDFLATYA